MRETRFLKMPNCGAPDCKNRSQSDEVPGIYRLIPNESKNKTLRDKWLAQIKRRNIPKYLYICSDHFEADCFEKDLEVSQR